MGRTVAVTGATGFIGKVLLQKLAGNNWQVRALTRRLQATDNPAVTWIRGDLDDIDAMRRMVAGADAVVHCAGTVRGSSRSHFYRTNAEGTAKLVRVCKQRQSPPRFLLVSSLAAKQPELSWYASSKRIAEQILQENARGIQWTIFRPTAVYGPGDREIKPLFKLSKLGFLPMPGFTATRFSLIHVDDLSDAMLCWLETENPVPGAICELADASPDGYDRHALAAIAQQAWGRTVRTLPLPASLVYLTAYLNLGLARLCRYSPMLTPGKVRELLHSHWLCDGENLQQSLPGWRPRISLQEALPDLIQ